MDLRKIEFCLTDTEKREYERVERITPHIFEQFLVEKGVGSDCLSCGSASLFVPHTIVHEKDPEDADYDEAADHIYVTPFINPGMLFRVGYAFYEVQCSNCGFVRKYLAHPVVSWMEEKGRSKA